MSLNEDHVRFGFCDKRCWQDIISNEKDNRFMESQAQTFPRSTFNEVFYQIREESFFYLYCFQIYFQEHL